jgi:diguanylate cyclase (GGDEF)-like protein
VGRQVNTDSRNDGGRESALDPTGGAADEAVAAAAAQTLADSDQTSADADQTASDADQLASSNDQTSADSDQRASDRDQATADRDHAADPEPSAADETAYNASRTERAMTTFERFANERTRSRRASERDETARRRDQIAAARDNAGRARDARVGSLADALHQPAAAVTKQLFRLGLEAAADRARAAEDRQRAAADRAHAARDKAALEAALRSAHLDELTGAYRREMGRLALTQEIERARRADGRLVVAFVDVDGLKDLNDREGHAAGDRVLQGVVAAIRTKLRSFDPITRYGGDEFVCGLGGTDLAEAEHRFESIGAAIQAAVGVGISVGLVALGEGDTADALTARADAAMLEVKAAHHSRSHLPA